MSANNKISVVEKIGYSLGDLAANLVFQTLVTFIAYYYTDVYKLEATTAQWVIGTCGIIGGVIFSPIMGIIADRTNTRWGKYRPWILITAIPFAVVIFLAFTTPNFSYNGKVIYAFITYLLLVSLYTANNLPYSSLSGVITGDMKERNSISSYRFVAVMIAQFIIQVLLRPLVLVVGDGNEAVGFEKIMMVFAIVSVVLFIITFFTTKERVVSQNDIKSSIKDDISDLLKNRPWIIMLFVTIFIFVTLALKGGTYVYYFKYYVDNEQMAIFLNDIGFISLIEWIQGAWPNFRWPDEVDASAFGLFNGSGIIMMIVGIQFSKPLADKFGKRNVFTVFLFISALFLLAFVAIPPKSIVIMFVFQILHGLSYGVTIPVLWAMIADVADYSEWKNRRRATAIIFSAMILGLKGGLTIGGTLVVSFLSAYGYNSTLTVQPESAVFGMKMMVSVFSFIAFLIPCILLFFYEINKTMESQIEKELKERRN
ncbi:MAG: MFS transporter [Marinilabiliaceae bacterium]|nr:MFS transporter [Marinilabiliaceae bacterium]